MTEQSAAGEPEQAAPSPPARRGPPVETAEETLSPRGERAAGALRLALRDLMIESGGRDDVPWARIDRRDLLRAASACASSPNLAMDMLHCLLAVDYEERIELNYALFSLAQGHKAILKVDLPPDDARADSLVGLWDAAGWHERETHDLFGVRFDGNPDLSPLLLYEGFEGRPGLRSFPLHDYEEW